MKVADHASGCPTFWNSARQIESTEDYLSWQKIIRCPCGREFRLSLNDLREATTLILEDEEFFISNTFFNMVDALKEENAKKRIRTAWMEQEQLAREKAEEKKCEEESKNKSPIDYLEL